MLAKLKTYALVGIDALPVEVEVDVSPSGLPKTVLVGLPEAAVKESTHRVERAIVNSGFQRPQSRVVINLAPADLPKDAASFDLPIALGILVGSGQVASELLEQYAVVGELALDGSTRPTKGALSMAMAAAAAEGLRGLLVPTESAAEAAVVEGIERHRRRQPRPGRRLSRRRTRDRADALPAGRPLPRAVQPTTSISPTCAARRWPSGR